MKAFSLMMASALLLTLCMSARAVAADDAKSPPSGRFFELRKYFAAPGKLDDLHARFRDHTNALFAKHGMTIIGFWVPTEGPDANKALIYILAFPSKEAHDKSWADFRADEAWKKAQADSEKDGKLVDKVESTFMTPTDYSPIK